MKKVQKPKSVGEKKKIMHVLRKGFSNLEQDEKLKAQLALSPCCSNYCKSD